jgi:hypothetical protein
MKKILIIAFLVVCTASLQAQWINNTENKSFNFTAPYGATAIKNEVLFPFTEKNTYTPTTPVALSVSQMVIIYSTASGTLTAATTFNLTINAHVTTGAMLLLEVKSDGTARDFIPGTGFIGVTTAGTINKTKWLMFIYNGTAFIHVSTNQVN